MSFVTPDEYFKADLDETYSHSFKNEIINNYIETIEVKIVN